MPGSWFVIPVEKPESSLLSKKWTFSTTPMKEGSPTDEGGAADSRSVREVCRKVTPPHSGVNAEHSSTNEGQSPDWIPHLGAIAVSD